jgi:hypothetical protein
MLHLPDPLETLLEADLIDAALICEDLTHQAIAGLFQYDLEVIRLEEQLFFNYRDRRSEGLYTVQMFSATRLDSPGSNLKRLAYRTRNSHWVLSAAGILRPAEVVLPPEVLADHIERDLLRLAVAGLRKNLLSRSANPARIVQRHESVVGFSGMRPINKSRHSGTRTGTGLTTLARCSKQIQAVLEILLGQFPGETTDPLLANGVEHQRNRLGLVETPLIVLVTPFGFSHQCRGRSRVAKHQMALGRDLLAQLTVIDL